MGSRQYILISCLITAVAVSFLYEPVSLIVYRVREPYFLCPVDRGKNELVVRSDGRGDGEFGAKRRNGRSHSGIDIIAAVGTPVRAAKSGVAFCGEVPTGYGKYVMIYHPDGFQTMYGHLSKWGVVSTKKVRRGDIIGFVGKSGNAAYKSIQPHLHFEIKKNGEPLDPRAFMR